MILRPVTRPAVKPVIRSVIDGGSGRSLEQQIAALFASGEQGAWYDPSDLSTLYQDSAGTTPVTALGQPVGLMLDKSKGLVRGPELWPQTALNAAAGLTLDANWTIAGGVATSDGGSGFIKVTVNPLTLGKWYEATMDVASYASGAVNLPYDGVGTNIVTVTSAGSYRRVFLAKSTELRVYSQSFAGSIDNISVRELPGNHASQPTATARPTLQARVNLLPATEGDLVGWIRQRGLIVTGNAATAPDGTTTAIVLTSDGSDAAQSVYSTLPCVINTDYVTRVYLRGITTTQAYVNAYNGVSPYANIAQSLRVVTGAGYIDGNYVKGLSTSDWTLVEIASKPTEVVFRPIAIFPGNTGINPAGTEIAIWHPQVELGSTATTYQRVTTATDYADVGAKRYLEFDGVDDLLATTFPDLGANVTIGRSLRTTGASILTGQTIGAGVRNDSTTHHGLVIINRALTVPETASLTSWLNQRAGV